MTATLVSFGRSSDVKEITFNFQLKLPVSTKPKHHGTKAANRLGTLAADLPSPRCIPPVDHQAWCQIWMDDGACTREARAVQPEDCGPPNPLTIPCRSSRTKGLYTTLTDRCPSYQERDDRPLRSRDGDTNPLYRPPTRPSTSRCAQDTGETRILRGADWKWMEALEQCYEAALGALHWRWG